MPVAVGLCVFAPAAHAAVVQVNTTADELNTNASTCSLREAMTVTNADDLTGTNGCTPLSGALGDILDTITFDPSVFNPSSPHTITLGSGGGGSGQLAGGSIAGQDLTIQGPGADSLTVNANGTGRVIFLDVARHVILEDFTVTGGVETGADNGAGAIFGGGGGIYSKTPIDLTLDHMVVTGNHVNVNTATLNADAEGGGVYATTPLTVVDSVIKNNGVTASETGVGTVAIARGGGIAVEGAKMSISTSTINNNTAAAPMGDTKTVQGAGVAYSDGAARDFGLITNSTITANTLTTADNTEGGGFWTNQNNPSGAVGLYNDTFYDNASSAAGSNIYATSNGAALANTIVGRDSDVAAANCAGGSVSSGDFNLRDDATCGTAAAHDVPTSTPLVMFGPIDDSNGGPTPTIPPPIAAVDQGYNEVGASPGIDQRGAPRSASADFPGVANAVTGDGSDIGAYEVQTGAPIITSTTPGSPSKNLNPTVFGTHVGVDENDQVQLYTDVACTTTISPGPSSPSDFGFTGIPITVPPNATTPLYAQGSYGAAHSACTGPFNYTADNTAPPKPTISQTKLGKSTRNRTARFRFSSPGSGNHYKCKIDKKSFKTCKSGVLYKHLKKGRHTFRVEAIDPVGNISSVRVKSFRFKK